MASRPKPHDHAACVSDAMARAEHICAETGARFTPLRRRVLERIWAGHKPTGAYEILEDLGRDDGKPVAPVTVYRALDFLMAHGLVHRLNSLNAFIGCPRAGAGHEAVFLICEDCKRVAEIDDPAVGETLARDAADQGFSVSTQMIEVMGRCPDCQAAAHG
ncbi:MAG: transcriptional repressor [Rhodobacterales bacterium]|nr:transcriptional repressor [Rhodobacterales bacterium]